MSSHSVSIQPRVPPWSFTQRVFGFNGAELTLIVPIAGTGIAGVVGLIAILDRILGQIHDAALNLWARSPTRNQVILEAGIMRRLSSNHASMVV